MKTGQILTDKQKAQKLLEELIEHELGDYSFIWKIKDDTEFEDEDCCYYFDVEYGMYDDYYDVLTFKINVLKETIEICMYEDVFEEIREYDWRIKYFWMKIKWR
jgi:hypothetical protein